MIVGTGLLARAFSPRFGGDPKVAIFASGVSDSSEVRGAEFARERELLLELLQSTVERLVYFGSCDAAAVNGMLTPYLQHKKQMESLVLVRPGGLVLRLPQVVGKVGNPHTLAHFLRDRILSGEHFTVWKNAERNLVDIDDVVAIGGALIAGHAAGVPSPVSIAAKASIPMPEIVGMFERALGKAANCTMVRKGHALPVEVGAAVEVAARLGIDLGPDYIESVVRKYCAAV